MSTTADMVQVKLPQDGQTTQVLRAITEQDDRLQHWIGLTLPQYAQGKIARETDANGQLIALTITSTPGDKGQSVIEALADAPTYIPEALRLLWRLRQAERARELSFEEQLAAQPHIAEARKAAKSARHYVSLVRQRLAQAQPVRARYVPPGF